MYLCAAGLGVTVVLLFLARISMLCPAPSYASFPSRDRRTWCTAAGVCVKARRLAEPLYMPGNVIKGWDEGTRHPLSLHYMLSPQ
jgi:hypothetical protein